MPRFPASPDTGVRPARQPVTFVLDWISGANPFTVAARHEETPAPHAEPDKRGSMGLDPP